MTLLLPTLAFAAFCVWLTVRIVNRHERWVKWTLAAVVGLPVLYVASFGPACWLCEKGILGQRTAWILFRPLTWLCVHGDKNFQPLRDYAISCGYRMRMKQVYDNGTGKISFLTHCWWRCTSDSVSPIDLEIEYRDYYRNLAKGFHPPPRD